MIGALLIVGGPEIVPFHRLPNPLDDPDIDVPSDNPYATRDENYFIPEWPVGRLPGGSDADPRLLVAALRRISAHHVDLSSENSLVQADHRLGKSLDQTRKAVAAAQFRLLRSHLAAGSGQCLQ